MGSGCTLTFKKIHTNSSDIRCGHTEANYSGYICVIMRGQTVTADQTREHFRHLLWWSLVLVRGEAPVLHYWSKMDLQRPNTSVDQRSLHWSDRSTWSFRHPVTVSILLFHHPQVPTSHQPGGAGSLPRSVSAPEMWRASDFSSVRQETWKKHISFPLMFYNLEYSLEQLTYNVTIGT